MRTLPSEQLAADQWMMRQYRRFQGHDILDELGASSRAASSSEGGGGVSKHNLLSTSHVDTLTGTVVRGDLVVGDATPNWARLPKGAANSVLACDGTDPAWSTTPTLAGLSLGTGGLNTVGTITPAADSTYNLGTSGPLYFANAFVDRLTVNPTAFLDGANAGRIGITGSLDSFTMTANNSITIGSGNSATGDVLLKFNIDRAWQFEVSGEGASAALVLGAQVDGKTFQIWAADDTPAFSFTISNAGSQLAAENILPSTDSTWTLGLAGYYWSNLFADRVTVNSTAYLDGANAGRLGITGTLDSFTLTNANNITINAGSIITDTTTGLKVGSATNQKVALHGVTPVIQAAHIIDPTDLATCITRIAAILVVLENKGLTAAA